MPEEEAAPTRDAPTALYSPSPRAKKPSDDLQQLEESFNGDTLSSPSDSDKEDISTDDTDLSSDSDSSGQDTGSFLEESSDSEASDEWDDADDGQSSAETLTTGQDYSIFKDQRLDFNVLMKVASSLPAQNLAQTEAKEMLLEQMSKLLC